MKFILISLSVTLFCNFASCNHVAQRFRSYDVQTDLVDVAPTVFLDVTYPGNIEISFGRVLRPNEVTTAPQVKWKADRNTFYTLMMVDPDNPSVPQHSNRSAKRWLLGNIQGNDMASGNILASYTGPRPLEGSGLHRYVFLLYKQNGRIDFDETEPQSEEERYHFNVRNFIQKYHLGNPVAGQLFESRAP